MVIHHIMLWIHEVTSIYLDFICSCLYCVPVSDVVLIKIIKSWCREQRWWETGQVQDHHEIQCDWRNSSSPSMARNSEYVDIASESLYTLNCCEHQNCLSIVTVQSYELRKLCCWIFDCPSKVFRTAGIKKQPSIFGIHSH